MKKFVCALLALCFTLILVPANACAADIADLVSACEDCHGKDGASLQAEVPSIGGFSAQSIVDSFVAYKDKTRPCEEVQFLESHKQSGLPQEEKSDMCKVTEALSEQEIQQIAEHFAAQPFVPAEQEFDPELVSNGNNEHAINCQKCHEDGGSSPDDDAGILAGQWMLYLEKQFAAYASGERAMPNKMKPKMDKLSESDIKALLHYYGSVQ